MRRRVIQVFLAASTLVFLVPRPALAQWPSWYAFGTEGSYVHELAHLLFALAMIFFIQEIFHAGLQRFRGFRLLAWAWGLLAWWNLDAIVGHWAEWTLKNPVISGEGFGRRILMTDLKTWIFYIGKIDHFILLVPAFYLLYRGLQVLERQAGVEGP
jgi:hypothetical protein